MYPDIAAWLVRCGEAYHVIRLAGTSLPSPRLHRPQPDVSLPLETGTQAHEQTSGGIEGALVPPVSRARTAARPESTEIAMSGWPMEQVPKKLTAGISFPGTRKTRPVAMKQLHLLSRWTCTYRHQHPARIICTLPWRPSVLPVYLSALHLQIPLGSVSPERGKRVPRRPPRDRGQSTPLIAETSQHSRASSARGCPSGSGPRPCGRKSLRYGCPSHHRR